MVGFNGFLCANMPSFLWNRMSLSETPGQLDDGWPESEKRIFQAALRMVVVKK